MDVLMTSLGRPQVARVYAYRTKFGNAGNTVASTNQVIDLLMTSKLKMFKLWLYAYYTKFRNPDNTVALKNPVLPGFLNIV